MARDQVTVAEQRKYSVLDVEDARRIARTWLESVGLANAVLFGLPEVDDRYHVWRVPLVGPASQERIGETVIDARTSLIIERQTTRAEVLEARLLGRSVDSPNDRRAKMDAVVLSSLRNTIACGDSEEVLQDLPAESVNLAFTSPPYYNARPEYTDYVSYEDYLLKIQRVIRQTHRVLSEGRFFVMNVSPVLVRRASRSEASRRIAVPFDMHRLFQAEGFDFIDDILWVKPEGAGWATGRGRRFSADRQPLQYKAVPVTENVLVYRKHTDKLIDWNIRSHPNQRLVEESRIGGDYEPTNLWRIDPVYDARHPAIFPVELAERVIAYYSFKQDVVLDPFAGIGTVGKAAVRLARRFFLIEQEPQYVRIMLDEAKLWLGKEAENILTINTPGISADDMLF